MLSTAELPSPGRNGVVQFTRHASSIAIRKQSDNEKMIENKK
jgi:hypothetical protein